MKIKNKAVDTTKDFTTVAVEGELDKVGLEDIRTELDEIVKSLETNMFVLDLADLKFINSEGVGYLLMNHYRLLKQDKKFVIVHAIDHVKDVLDVVGLLSIVPYFDSLELFVKSL